MTCPEQVPWHRAVRAAQSITPQGTFTEMKEEVRDLDVWCQDNHLSLNVIKTKEMIVDYRKRRTEHATILINGAVVEQVESFKFLKRFGMGPQIRQRFYSCTIETGCIIAWYDNCSASDCKALQKVVHHWGQASCHPGPLYQAVPFSIMSCFVWTPGRVAAAFTTANGDPNKTQ
jgi:hypothetical protein